MAAEGIFPKTDGDILFASGVNRFAKAGEFVGIGATGAIGTSGTAYQLAGSEVIPANTFQTPFSLILTGRITDTSADFQLGLSGNTNTTLNGFNSSTTPGNALSTVAHIIIGSPMDGFVQMSSIPVDVVGGAGSIIRVSTTIVPNLDPGSDIVINLSIQNAENEAKFMRYSIQGFRGVR